MDMRLGLVILVVLIVGIGVVLMLPAGQEPLPGPSPGPGPGPEPGYGTLEIEPVALSGIDTEAPSLTEHYSLEGMAIDLQAPAYDLPLDTGDISNYADFSGDIELSPGALDLLSKNGFAVIDDPFRGQNEYFGSAYKKLKDAEVPVFITTDSLLHMYHIQFDESLREIEEREFYDDIWSISEALLEDAMAKYNGAQEGELKEALRRNAAYFAVGLSLLQPAEDQLCQGEEWECRYTDEYFTEQELDDYSFTMPDAVKESVDQELALIEKHEGLEPSPLFTYKEDYSQYIPRGHYTRSEKLKNYFKAMMWYGRISMLLRGKLISEEDAFMQTMQASLITAAFAEDEEVRRDWERIYSVTAFYVGYSDDLGPYEYMEAINSVFGDEFDPSSLDAEAVTKLKAELAAYRAPKIYGGTGWGGGGVCSSPPTLLANPDQLDACLEATKGFRLMGQRFIPDSYMFQGLVHAAVGNRLMPKSLDVMALLGSGRAYGLLEEMGEMDRYPSYVPQFNKLKEEFDAFDEADWNKNLYWSWLYALKPLLKEFGEGYPTFMQTEAWQEKELSTALASWTELRHDTILYAKQSYTMEATAMPPEPKPVVGYIEPVPEFYNRLLALSRMTREGLTEMDVLSDAAVRRLESLETVLQCLRDLSVKELENEELTEIDYEFIKDFDEQVDYIVGDVADKAKKTTIVADVHTDPNTGSVLEEGVGYIGYVVVAYKVPDGRILIGAGPVMTYYEFRQPMSDRLTDEKWRELLKSDPPEKPEWTSGFSA